MTGYPRPDVLAARDAGIAVNFTGAIIATAFLVLEALSVLRKRKAAFAAARRDGRHARTPYCGGCAPTDAVLSAVTVLSLWVFCQSVALWWVDWNQVGGPAACNRFVNGAVPLSYLSVKQATYILLTERVRAVHNALAMNSLAFRAFRGVVYLTVWLGVPVMFWPFAFLFFGGHVMPEGICVEYSRELFPIYMFLACDLLLSVGLLFLFVAPVVGHVKRMEALARRPAAGAAAGAGAGTRTRAGTRASTPTTTRAAADAAASSSQRKVMRVAQRNLAISTVMILYTVFSMTMFVYELRDAPAILARGEELGATHITASIIPGSDVLVNLFLVHAILTKWIPPSWRAAWRRIRAHASHSSSRNGREGGVLRPSKQSKPSSDANVKKGAAPPRAPTRTTRTSLVQSPTTPVATTQVSKTLWPSLPDSGLSGEARLSQP